MSEKEIVYIRKMSDYYIVKYNNKIQGGRDEKVDFNKGWLLQKNGSAKTQEVNLPHDAMLAEERNKDVLTGGASAYFDGGKYYYRKN